MFVVINLQTNNFSKGDGAIFAGKIIISTKNCLYNMIKQQAINELKLFTLYVIENCFARLTPQNTKLRFRALNLAGQNEFRLKIQQNYIFLILTAVRKNQRLPEKLLCRTRGGLETLNSPGSYTTAVDARKLYDNNSTNWNENGDQKYGRGTTWSWLLLYGL